MKGISWLKDRAKVVSLEHLSATALRKSHRGFLHDLLGVLALVSVVQLVGLPKLQADQTLRLRAGSVTTQQGELVSGPAWLRPAFADLKRALKQPDSKVWPELSTQTKTNLKPRAKSRIETQDLSPGRGRSPAKHFVVQYTKSIRRVHHQQLRAFSIKPLRYIPENALLVRAEDEQIELLKANAPDLSFVLPYFSQFKLSPELGPSSFVNSQEELTVLVRSFEAAQLDALASSIEALGAQIETVSGRTAVLRASRQVLAGLAELEGIEWIQPRGEIRLMEYSFRRGRRTPVNPPPADPYAQLTGYESGLKIMGIEAARARGLSGHGQKVAVADTGLDRGDALALGPDLRGRTQGQVFALHAKNWADVDGHGTHVSGLVAGNGSLSRGRLGGSAPNANLLIQSLWSSEAKGFTFPPTLVTLFDAAKKEGVNIHSNSWGISSTQVAEYEAWASQVDEYAFNNPEFLLLFAAGNDGVDFDRNGRVDPGSVTSPGTAKNVLTVGASENLVSNGGVQSQLGRLGDPKKRPFGVEPLKSDRLSNNPTGLAAFSSRGPTKDGRIKPEVVAPGTNILSLRSKHPDSSDLWGMFSADYVWSGGTSMATPLVAGAAAMIREHLKRDRNIDRPSSALIKNLLMHSAFDLFPGQFGAVGEARGQEILKTRPTADAGFGRVDLERLMGLNQALVIDDKTGVGPQETHQYPLRLTRAGRVTVSVVWTDAPASPTAAVALVNDLDLTVKNAQGQIVQVSIDRLNNWEFIETQMAPGDYEIEISGFNVPQGRQGRQPYSLVVSSL